MLRRGILASLALLLAACEPDPVGWAYEPFPKEIGFRRVIAWTSDLPFNVRESCMAALMELHPESAEKIGSRGLAFLNGLSDVEGRPKLTKWHRGPLPKVDASFQRLTPEGHHLYADVGISCDNKRQALTPERARLIELAMERGEGYYATFNGGEGLLIVVPTLQWAMFAYFG
jgi:hypothetical protein